MPTEKKVSTPRTVWSAAALVAASCVAAACGNSTGPETARLKVQLTDAPADEIAMAEVWISRIYLQGGDDGEEGGESQGRIDLFNDPSNPHHFDLLTLRDGITADLTDFEEVASGMYQGLRFVVDSARVTLVEGLTFDDGETTAKLITPSAQQSGIKVSLNGMLDVQGGETTTLVVDFDVDRSFVVQSNGPSVRRVIFTPRLHEAKRDNEEQS